MQMQPKTITVQIVADDSDTVEFLFEGHRHVLPRTAVEQIAYFSREGCEASIQIPAETYNQMMVAAET